MAEQVTMDDLHIHGGVVQQVTCMGDVYMHGGVVNTMEVQGDCKQSGGVINRRIQQSVSQTVYHQPEPKVVYRDRVVYKDRKVFYNNPSLSAENTNLKRENEKLRQALKERDEKQPSDDILLSKIRRLENQLKEERGQHRKKVEELEWRLKAVTDIANGRNERIYEDETNGHYIGVTDNSLDVLFTLINEYPIASDRDMAEEMGISITTLRYIAKALRLAKSPEARREAKERLNRHGIEMIERRGGDQGNYPSAKPVEKVGKYGRLIKSYDSLKAAARDNGLCTDTVREHCNRYHKANKFFTKDGYTFRFKKSNYKN